MYISHQVTACSVSIVAHQDSESGQAAALKLLIHFGTEIGEADNLGKTAIHYASEKNHPECVSILLQRGAPTDLLDSNSRVPLHYACMNGSYIVLNI